MPNIADDGASEGWRGLLGVLSDEELGQYGDMALDQARQESRRAAVHAVMLIAAICLIAWAAWTIYTDTVGGWLVYLALAASAVLIYLPWQSLKVRKLWLGHHARVREEVARRQRGASSDKNATDGG